MSSVKASSIVSQAARVGAMTMMRRVAPDATKASRSGGRYGSRTLRSAETPAYSGGFGGRTAAFGASTLIAVGCVAPTAVTPRTTFPGATGRGSGATWFSVGPR